MGFGACSQRNLFFPALIPDSYACEYKRECHCRVNWDISITFASAGRCIKSVWFTRQ